MQNNFNNITENNINIIIGNVIKRKRKELKMTQQDLADFLNITYQQVQKYEKAKNKTSSETIFKLAEFFKISILEFFDIKNEKIKIELNKEEQEL